MTSTLGDVVLVLLGDRPAGAHELRQRHAEALGPHRQVDITRVVATLTRQERLGYIRTDPALSRGSRRVWALTEAGDRRQRSWILAAGPDTDHDDILVRVLLAVAATDRATFDAVIAAGLRILEQRRRRSPAGRAGAVTAPQALAEFDRALAVTTIDWLRRLRGRPRERD
jgi:DNA-binding PadR family transcriptional regulator